MTPETARAIELVQKLLNLAAKNPNPEEAASAASKAQKILAEHNLEMSAVEEASGVKSGKREKAKMLGGMYQYQRDLWKSVAELNFCIYWNQMVWEKRKVQRYDAWSERYRTVEDYAKTWQHRVVGRVVNVTATKILAQYLEAAVERLLTERLCERSDRPNTQRFSSWAVAFREGAIDDITDRLADRRREMIDEQKAELRAAEARARARAAEGVTTETALSLELMAQTERDANLDEIAGEEGWSARQRVQKAEAARLAQEEEARYAQWAADNPEEAENRRYWSRYRGGSAAPERASDKNGGAYNAGRKAGASIGLDTQMGGASGVDRRLK